MPYLVKAGLVCCACQGVVWHRLHCLGLTLGRWHALGVAGLVLLALLGRCS